MRQNGSTGRAQKFWGAERCWGAFLGGLLSEMVTERPRSRVLHARLTRQVSWAGTLHGAEIQPGDGGDPP